MHSPSIIVICLASLITATTAHAWTRPGHMVTGAIAYEELLTSDRRVIEQIVEIMTKHPDRSPFDVATGRSAGDERARRVFMQMARWADDIRGSSYDHPTWHYAARPIIDQRQPPTTRTPGVVSGAALEAFASNWKLAADARGNITERAVALCWLFHLIGDIHQPLHAADEFNINLPEGDRGGGLQYTRAPGGEASTNLHSFWDGLVRNNGEAAAVSAQARRFIARMPRAQFRQLADRRPPDFTAWAMESFDLAKRVVYHDSLVTTLQPRDARTMPDAYFVESVATGERQVTLAGYRLADALRQLFVATP